MRAGGDGEVRGVDGQVNEPQPAEPAGEPSAPQPTGQPNNEPHVWTPIRDEAGIAINESRRRPPFQDAPERGVRCLVNMFEDLLHLFSFGLLRNTEPLGVDIRVEDGFQNNQPGQPPQGSRPAGQPAPQTPQDREVPGVSDGFGNNLDWRTLLKLQQTGRTILVGLNWLFDSLTFGHWSSVPVSAEGPGERYLPAYGLGEMQNGALPEMACADVIPAPVETIEAGGYSAMLPAFAITARAVPELVRVVGR